MNPMLNQKFYMRDCSNLQILECIFENSARLIDSVEQFSNKGARFVKVHEEIMCFKIIILAKPFSAGTFQMITNLFAVPGFMT